MGIQRSGPPARFNTAETATAGAGIAHEHDGSSGSGFVAAAPAVGNIGAAGFLADSVEVQAAQVFLEALVVLGVGDGGFQPGWKTGHLLFAAGGADESGFKSVGFGRVDEGRIVVVAGNEIPEGWAGVELVCECGAAAWFGGAGGGGGGIGRGVGAGCEDAGGGLREGGPRRGVEKP